MSCQPTVETARMRLVGVQVVVDLRQPFAALLAEGWARLVERLGDIPDLVDPPTAISYMQFIDAHTRVWFLGAHVESLDAFTPDHAAGLIGWDLGEASMAVWPEADGAEGSVARYAYGVLDRTGLAYDARFMGEFERRPLADVRYGAPAGGEHQFMLPVRS